MFEKFVTAVEPFGLTVVVLAGLTLTGRIQFADSVIVGYVTVFVGASLIVLHIYRQMKSPDTKPKAKKVEKKEN